MRLTPEREAAIRKFHHTYGILTEHHDTYSCHYCELFEELDAVRAELQRRTDLLTESANELEYEQGNAHLARCIRAELGPTHEPDADRRAKQLYA